MAGNERLWTSLAEEFPAKAFELRWQALKDGVVLPAMLDAADIFNRFGQVSSVEQVGEDHVLRVVWDEKSPRDLRIAPSAALQEQVQAILTEPQETWAIPLAEWPSFSAVTRQAVDEAVEKFASKLLGK